MGSMQRWVVITGVVIDTGAAVGPPARSPKVGVSRDPACVLEGRPDGVRTVDQALHDDVRVAGEIHQLGLREVERIEREMQAIARDYGFTGSLAAFEQELAGRPGMKFESQDEMLAYATDVLDALQPTMPRLFSVSRARPGRRAAHPARPRGLAGVELHAPAPPTGRARRGST